MKRWRNLLGFALLLIAGVAYGRAGSLYSASRAFGTEAIIFTVISVILALAGLFLLALDEYHRISLRRRPRNK